MIVGHERVIKDLKKIADEKDFSHGYIFYGPKRIGKSLVARGLANYLEFGVFETAGKILGDTLFIEPTLEKTIGIDRVREIKHFLSQAPNRSPYRMVIINEAECMTSEAQNALLKVAEEPPTRSLLILVAHDLDALWPTVQSRLHKLHFSPVSINKISKWLVDVLDVPKTKADSLVNESHGAPGFAWAALYDEGFRDVRTIAKKFLHMNEAEAKTFIKELVAEEQFDLDNFLEVLLIESLPIKPKNINLFHSILKLREEASNFNLNPRLQLMALVAQNK